MKSEPFQTSDISTAAYLLIQPSLTLKGLTPKDRRSKYFLFAPPIDAKRLAFDFLSGKGMVNARQYADALRMAKDLIFDAERRGAVSRSANVEGGQNA